MAGARIPVEMSSMNDNIVPLSVPSAAARQDGWFGSTGFAVALTAVIFVLALACGNGVALVLNLAYGWTFPLAVLFIVAELWIVMRFVARARRKASDVGAPRRPPVNRAA